MSKILLDSSEFVRHWAAIQLGTTFVDPCFAIGVLNRRGHLVGAVIYNAYEFRNVEATAVGKFGRYATAEICAYAFDRLDCLRISLTIPERNPRLIKMLMRMGFEIEGLKREYYGEGEHAIILGMLRQECKIPWRTAGKTVQAPASHRAAI